MKECKVGIYSRLFPICPPDLIKSSGRASSGKGLYLVIQCLDQHSNKIYLKTPHYGVIVLT
jgi:hypothetical protein